jgi:hypothetical protein
MPQIHLEVLQTSSDWCCKLEIKLANLTTNLKDCVRALCPESNANQTCRTLSIVHFIDRLTKWFNFYWLQFMRESELRKEVVAALNSLKSREQQVGNALTVRSVWTKSSWSVTFMYEVSQNVVDFLSKVIQSWGSMTWLKDSCMWKTLDHRANLY